MKKTAIIFMALFVSLVLIGCAKQPAVQSNETLYNQTLNEQLDDLTNPNTDAGFVEFDINFAKNPSAKYDFAGDDVLELEGDNFDSSKYAVLGVKVGDSYQSVIEKLGQPDVMFVASDQSYRNLEYSKKIGIGDVQTAITYHADGDIITIINMRLPFNNYLVGNTTLGRQEQRDYLYSKVGVPDYQDFTETHRVFHYIEKGIDFYMTRNEVEIMSLYNPKEFKGVYYKTVQEKMSDGFYINVTKAFLIE